MDKLIKPDKKYQINMPEGTKVLSILEGRALDPKGPKGLEIMGKIDAPISFYKVRKDIIDKNKCHVIATENSITLHFNEDDHWTYGFVCGQLRVAGECVQWHINESGALFDSKELARLIKKNEYLFAKKEEWKTIYNALMRFESNVQIHLRDIKETTGDMEKAIQVTVKNDMPKGFTLKTKVLSNDKKQYWVDLGAEFTGQNIKFYLDSADLAFGISKDQEKLIEDYTKIFIDDGIAVIQV